MWEKNTINKAEETGVKAKHHLEEAAILTIRATAVPHPLTTGTHWCPVGTAGLFSEAQHTVLTNEKSALVFSKQEGSFAI